MLFFKRFVHVVFVISLALFLAGGLAIVLAQAGTLMAGNSESLIYLNDVAKIPVCVAASICAIAGFLLSYFPQQEATTQGAPHGF
jgi:hypothetical protein